VPEVRWAALLPDAGLVQGSGKETGLRQVLEQATAVMFVAPGLPPLYCAGVGSVKWTLERDMVTHRLEQRYWGIEPAAGARL